MKHIITTLSLLLFVGTQTASAQYPFGVGRGVGSTSGLNQLGRPTFSPYLNLLRRGNSTLGNYYGLVRPEQEFRAANAQFQAGLGQLNRQFSQFESGPQGRQMQTTGHQVQFLSNLRGSPGSLRRGRLPVIPGSTPQAFGPTGHTAVFGNNGTWYSGLQQQQRRR